MLSCDWPQVGCTLAFAGVIVLALSSAPAWGAGQAIGIKHPVLQRNLDYDDPERYEKAVTRVMGMSDEEMLSFVPDKPYICFVHCPNCHGGSQGFQGYEWSIDRPDELKCKYCGMVFPNDQYPEDQIESGQNALGETVSYTYYHDQEIDARISHSGHILYPRRSWIVYQCRLLGEAYQVTGKPEYARRAVLILDRIA